MNKVRKSLLIAAKDSIFLIALTIIVCSATAIQQELFYLDKMKIKEKSIIY
jgi:hypothetical protein